MYSSGKTVLKPALECAAVGVTRRVGHVLSLAREARAHAAFTRANTCKINCLMSHSTSAAST